MVVLNAEARNLANNVLFYLCRFRVQLLPFLQKKVLVHWIKVNHHVASIQINGNQDL